MAFQFQQPKVVVRQVWQSNLAEEIELIQRCVANFLFASIDTEFPGTVFPLNVPKHAISSLSPAQHYANMKQNVDALNIIQLGLTLSDSFGNLPRLGPDQSEHVWQFNFRDFDPEVDLCDPDSITLLQTHGISLQTNRERGIHSQSFAWIFRNSGMGSHSTAWITFHGLYDFGFLIKILTREPLPAELNDFMALMRRYFGELVYDLKPISRVVGLYGGLEKVAKNLGLDEGARKSHQGGSDSLLTKQAFFRLVMNNPSTNYMLLKYTYMLYGLTTEKTIEDPNCF